MKFIAKKFTNRISILALLFFTVIVVITFWEVSPKKTTDTSDSITKVPLIAQELSTDFNTLQINLRNYFIDNDSDYLNKSIAATVEVLYKLKQLDSIIKPNHLLQKTYTPLKYLIFKKIAFSYSLISSYKKDSATASAKKEYAIKCTEYVTEIRSLNNQLVLDAFNKIENNRLLYEQRNREYRFIIYICLFILSISLIVISIRVGNKVKLTQEANKYLLYHKHIINESRDAIVSTDFNLNILSWNKGAEELFGYSEDEALNQNGLKFTGANALHKQRMEVWNILRTTGKWRGEITLTDKNNNKLYCSVSITVIKNNYNRITEFVGIITNITEIKNIKEERAYLTKLIDASNDAIIVFNEGLNIISWNKGAQKLYGYTDTEAIGKFEIDLISTDSNNSRLLGREIEQLPAGSYLRLENIHKKKNGELVTVDLSISVLTNPVTNKKNILAIVSDITERKRHEKWLKKFNEELEKQVNEKTAELKETFESIGEAFYALDENWVFTFVNEKGAELFNRTQESLLNKNIWDEFPILVRLPLSHVLNSVMKDKNFIHHEDYMPHLQKWLSYNIYPSPTGITMYVRDTSDEKKAKEDLVKMNYKLRELSVHLQNVREEERKYIAKEIHDQLGQITTALKIELAMLSRKLPNDPPELKNKVSEIMGLMEDVIKTVRRISLELRPSIIDDLGLIPALEYQFNEFEKRTGIETSFIHQLDHIVFSNEININIFRICQEALTNVMRYANATRVTASMVQEGNKITLIISDNGIGFDLKSKKQTFGIISMQERAYMMHGSLKIDTAIGKGTTIKLEVNKNGN